MRLYYVYIHKKPNGDIFYVGKGFGRRAWSPASRNNYWKNIVNKYGYEVEIMFESENEDLALQEEKRLISHFRNLFKLANLNDGGIGNSGWKASEEIKEKIRKANTGQKRSLESRKKMSDNKKGIAFWPKGKKRPPEFGQMVSARLKGKPKSPEHIEKCRVARVGIKHTPETIMKMKEQRQKGAANNRPIIVCGVEFHSMTAFARFVGVTPLCVKKWVDSGKTEKMEGAYYGAKQTA